MTISPPSLLIASPYDPDAHLGVKRDKAWIGYKLHRTETCDEDAPHLIVHSETTLATTPDWNMTDTIHAALEAQDCLPGTHIVDGGHVDAQALVSSQSTHGVEVLGPVPLGNSWQARSEQGLDLSHFQIDWQARTVRRPAGCLSRTWTPTKDRFGQDTVYVTFAAVDCLPCPLHEHCTRARTRSLTFRPQALYRALQAARQRQQTPAVKEAYAIRAGIESTISLAVRVSDIRQARYRGLPKVQLHHLMTATALNVIRLVSWLEEPSLRTTQVSRFAALALALREKPAA